MSLHGTHFNTKNALALCRERCQHIFLQSTQHQRLQLAMKLLNLDFVIHIGEIKLICQGNLKYK